MATANLKQRIHEGEILIGVGVNMSLTQSQLEDILSKDDYAFIWIDSQHEPLNEERLAEFCGMAESMGVHTQLRIKHTRHTYLVGNMVDLGPAGIEVPQVETEATVTEAVANFLYPQQGVRSLGGSNRYGSSEFADRHHEYMEWWNNTGVLWMQVESIHAIASARILAKTGVDCLSWGPLDLQLNLEGQPDHPFQSDDDCVQYAVKQLEGTETKLVYRSYLPELRNKYIDMGVTVLLENPQV